MDNHHRDSVGEGHFHVHFSEDTDEVGHTQVNIKRRSEFNYEAHVGFLQIKWCAMPEFKDWLAATNDQFCAKCIVYMKIYHKYKIIINLPIDDAKKDYALANDKIQSICIKGIHIEAKNDKQLEISAEFFAYKEKLLKENIVLTGPENKEIILTILARVLGKGKGTPMLREGVTCIGVEPVEDESEFSDWQGFE